MPTGNPALSPSLARPIVTCVAALLDDGLVAALLDDGLAAPVETVLHAVAASASAAAPATGRHDGLRRHRE
jgi:hypothetical protein